MMETLGASSMRGRRRPACLIEPEESDRSRSRFRLRRSRRNTPSFGRPFRCRRRRSAPMAFGHLRIEVVQHPERRPPAAIPGSAASARRRADCPGPDTTVATSRSIRERRLLQRSVSLADRVAGQEPARCLDVGREEAILAPRGHGLSERHLTLSIRGEDRSGLRNSIA